MAEARILLVDDDGPQRDAMCRALEQAGYEVACLVSAAEGQQHIRRYGAPDLLLLAVREVSRPTEVALCREIHAVEDVPVIALATEALQERVAVLLEECLDDFIITPAATGEIVARVRRCLRQFHRTAWPAGAGAASSAGGEQLVTIDGHDVLLTDREALLVRLLLRYPDRVLSQQYLLQQVWADGPVGEGTLRVTIHRLRRKIEKALGRPAHILSVRGRGYVYATRPAPSVDVATPPVAVA
jgi:DNA-binding response OmpR family regulator